jgi:hypothetical protein
MTAALAHRPAELHWIDLASSPALRLQPAPPLTAPGPTLRVIEGGRSPAAVARYRRRRVVLALAAALFVLVLAGVTGRLVTGTSWPTSPTSAAAASAAGVAAPSTYVVRAGDTLWSIAARVAPDLDVRIAVDRLVALNGPAPIVVGQELALP